MQSYLQLQTAYTDQTRRKYSKHFIPRIEAVGCDSPETADSALQDFGKQPFLRQLPDDTVQNHVVPLLRLQHVTRAKYQADGP